MTTIVKFLLILLLSFFSFMGMAQVSDETAIDQVARDNMECSYKNDWAPMEKTSQYGLAELCIGNSETFQRLQTPGYPELSSPKSLDGMGSIKNSDRYHQMTVEVLDLDADMASIVFRTPRHDFYDYMHRVKKKGQWDNGRVE